MRVESSSPTGSEIRLFVDSLDQLEPIAEAIFHAKMDADADAMQADRFGVCPVCGNDDPLGYEHAADCPEKSS